VEQLHDTSESSAFAPQGVKAFICGANCGATEEAAEESTKRAKGKPQALKRRHIFNYLTARLKSCPSQNPPNQTLPQPVKPSPVKASKSCAANLWDDSDGILRRDYY